MSCTWKPAHCSREEQTLQTARGVQFGRAISHVRWSTVSSLGRFNSRSIDDGCPRTPPCSCCVCAALPPSVHRRASMAPGARAQRRGGARHQTQHPSAASALPPRAQHNASPLTAARMRAAGCLLARLPCFVLGKLGWIALPRCPPPSTRFLSTMPRTIPFSLTRGALVPGTRGSSVTEVG